jgi:hypothetical protein
MARSPRLPAFAALSLMAGGLVVALAAPASAAEPVEFTELAVDPQVVVLKNTDENLFDVYAGVASTVGDIDRLDVDFGSPGGSSGPFGLTLDDWVLLDGTEADGLWGTSFALHRESRPGTWTLTGLTGVAGGEDVTSDGVTFQVKRNTVVSGFNATEPVKKGAATTASGTLKRLDPAARAYVGYSGKTVSIQFKARGTTSYQTVATVRTSSTGTFSKRIVATKDGVWRAVFAGTPYYVSSISGWDYVDVR